LIRYAIDTMVANGFTYVETPLMIRGEVVQNVVSLADQENQIYKIDNEDLYLIGTSEHSLIGRFLKSQLQEKQLPIKHTSYSMCFRKEKGSHGLDERGLYRTHQFNKVEMIVICKPEESMAYYQKMQQITVAIFNGLAIPVRVLGICSGDLGDLKHVQVDIEAWSPRRNGFFEVASCSNLVDAQARQLGIRVQGTTGNYYPHTLNNTAIATSRAMVAILENNQQADGSIKIPDVLVKHMYGKTHIAKQK
jgi:seryl-tRNA synthetase